jgi:alpha-N-arabinofuranosidase
MEMIAMIRNRWFLVLACGMTSVVAAHGQEDRREADVPTIKITREFLCPGHISPLQYGQFVEYLCNLIPGMWAEKLYDGSFEGLTPYKFAFLKETDFREKPWYPSGAVNRASFSLDGDNPVSGLVSKKIEVKEVIPCTVGISQDGIAVERGKASTFSCYLRKKGVEKPIQVRLHHEGKLLASCEFQAETGWKKFRAQLTPSETDANATLTIEFAGPGTLWLDNLSLMPDDNICGWRSDVVAAVKALKPGIIRFGGSALDEPGYGDFDWRNTIGDPDRRRPFRAWGGLQPTGAGLEEFVQFCRHVDAEPLICVRFSERTPKDAADQVEYFNGSTATPMGALRAKNGHPEPYRVKYWQVGNERSGQDYESKLADFCRAMKKIDPSIRLLSSYPSAGVLRQVGDLVDFVCPHHYDCGNLAATEDDIRKTRDLLRDLAPRKSIKIAVTEWNTTAGDWGPRRARLWTLENALACSRYHNLIHRHSDIVQIANRSNLTNSFCSGIIQTDNHRLYKTPTYYAQQLYATLADNRPLRVEPGPETGQRLDISATLASQNDAVIVFVVNDGLKDIARPLDFSTFGERGQEITTWTLTDSRHAGEPDVTNSFGDPERISPVKSKFQAVSPRFDYRFPSLSLTVMRWSGNK